MAKIKERTYEDALTAVRAAGFDVLEAPATAHRVFVKKHGCSAAIEKNADNDGVRLFAKPGYLIGGEISRLVDKGYQKFLQTTKTEVPATADHLKAIHAFSEELREAIGATSLYNEALGTTSDKYVYDRILDRDQPEPARKKRPWEALKGKTKKGA
ncbi:MAG: hypothetical protein ABIP12_04610 [Terriglobales bacterium]